MLLPLKTDESAEVLPSTSAENVNNAGNSLAYYIASATLDSLEKSLDDAKENIHQCFHVRKSRQNLLSKDIQLKLSKVSKVSEKLCENSPIDEAASVQNNGTVVTTDKLSNEESEKISFNSPPVNLDSIILIEKKVNYLRDFHRNRIRELLFGLNKLHQGFSNDTHDIPAAKRIRYETNKQKEINFFTNLFTAPFGYPMAQKKESTKRRNLELYEYHESKCSNLEKTELVKNVNYPSASGSSENFINDDFSLSKNIDEDLNLSDIKSKLSFAGFFQNTQINFKDSSNHQLDECDEREDDRQTEMEIDSSKATDSSTFPQPYFQWPIIQNCLLKNNLKHRRASRKTLALAFSNMQLCKNSPQGTSEEKVVVIQSPSHKHKTTSLNKCLKSPKKREKKIFDFQKNSSLRKNLSSKKKKKVHWAQDLFQVHYFNEDDKIGESNSSLNGSNSGGQDILLFPWNSNKHNKQAKKNVPECGNNDF